MSDAKDTDKPGGRKPLTLKRTTGAGTVNQSFARGKTKSVVVEKKRKRVLGPQSGGAPAKTREEAKKAPPKSDRGLSEEEMKSRQRAIEKARAEEEERRERQRAEEEERERRAAARPRRGGVGARARSGRDGDVHRDPAALPAVGPRRGDGPGARAGRPGPPCLDCSASIRRSRRDATL